MATEAQRVKYREQQRSWRQHTLQRAGTKECDCGCGTTIPRVRNDGKTLRRFAVGHKAKRLPGETSVAPNGYIREYGEEGWGWQHRLVWQRANGVIASGDQIHHKNGDKTDNRLENLEIVAGAEHAEKHWRERWAKRESQCANIKHLRAQGSSRSSSTPEQAVEIRKRVQAGEQVQEVAADLGLSVFAVSRIWSGKTWRCRICSPRKNKAGPKSKPLPRQTRTENLNIRVSPAEKSLIEANAARAGMSMSAFLRHLVVGPMPSPASDAAPTEPAALEDFETLVVRLTATMPRRNAETVARRELGRATVPAT